MGQRPTDIIDSRARGAPKTDDEGVSGPVGASEWNDLVFLSDRGATQVSQTSGAVLEALRELELRLRSKGLKFQNLVRLNVAYSPEKVGGREKLLDTIALALPKGNLPAITAVPVPTSTSEDGPILLNATASRVTIERGGQGESGFPDAVQTGNLVFTSAHTSFTPKDDIIGQSESVMEQLKRTLRKFDARLKDSVKFNIFYVGSGTAEDWEIAARVRARYFDEPGPVATGIPVPDLDDGLQIMMEITAERATDGSPAPRRHSWPEGHWDWPIHLPYRHGLTCGGLAFVGGQVALTANAQVIAPDDLERQVGLSVENIAKVLAELDLGLETLLKLNAFYAGSTDLAAFTSTLVNALRNHNSPVPAVSVLRLPCLAYRHMLVEIEAIAGSKLLTA